MVAGVPLSQNECMCAQATTAAARERYYVGPCLNTICKIREFYRIYEYLRKTLRTSINMRTTRAPYTNPPTLAMGRSKVERHSGVPQYEQPGLAARPRHRWGKWPRRRGCPPADGASCRAALAVATALAAPLFGSALPPLDCQRPLRSPQQNKQGS